MPNKNYTLVAWTENGEVRMIPSLVNDAAEPFRERIAHLESLSGRVRDEVGWLLARSRAHEAFGRFLLSVGHPREAYLCFENAAEVCTFCSDENWRQGILCDVPTLPLLRRFLAMHRECVRLAKEDRFLSLSYEGSDLQKDYRSFTLDSDALMDECRKAADSDKAWRFGKAS